VSPSFSPTATPSVTPTWSPSPSLTPSASPSATLTPTFSASKTVSPSPSPTQSPSFSASPTNSVSPTVSPDRSPTPLGSFAVSIQIFGSNGVLVDEYAGPGSDHAITNLTIGPSAFNPKLGSLNLASGDWGASYNGKDTEGAYLQNGSYVLMVISSQGSTQLKAQGDFSVLESPDSPIIASVAPNPVLRGENFLLVTWSSPNPIEIRIFNLRGEMVKRLEGLTGTSYAWPLQDSRGQTVSGGIYLIYVRDETLSVGKVYKAALLR
jgi:hypothetical protein